MARKKKSKEARRIEAEKQANKVVKSICAGLIILGIIILVLFAV